MKQKLLSTLFFLYCLTLAAQTHYYTKPSGNIMLNTTWGTNTDGSGTAPASLFINNAVFHMQNRSLFNLYGLGSMVFSGSNSTVVIGDGTNALTLAIPQGYYLQSDSFYLSNYAAMQLAGNINCNKRVYANNSVVQLTDTNAMQSILPGDYGKLVCLTGTSKKLTGNVRVRTMLTLSDAIIYTDSFELLAGTPTNTATINPFSGGIYGTLKQWMPAATQTYSTASLFPMYGAGRHFNLRVLATTASTAPVLYSVTLIPQHPGIGGLPLTDSSNGNLSVNRICATAYWETRVESGSANGIYSVYANPVNLGNILWEGSLRLVFRAPAGPWTLPGTSLTGYNSAYDPIFGRVNMSNIHGDFAIASDSIVNWLPITLLYARAIREEGNKFTFHWATATESNLSHFSVLGMRADGSSEELCSMPAAGNSNSLKKYTCSSPVGENYSQFMLEETDADGAKYMYAFTYSDDPATHTAVTLLNHPAANGTESMLQGLEPQVPVQIQLTDLSGKIIKTYTAMPDAGGFLPLNTADMSAQPYHLRWNQQGMTGILMLLKY